MNCPNCGQKTDQHNLSRAWFCLDRIAAVLARGDVPASPNWHTTADGTRGMERGR